MRRYKVLEVIWEGNNFYQEYCGTFDSEEEAQKFVDEHIDEWENDLYNYSEETTGIGIEIETWEKDSPEQDDSFEDLIDTYTDWCMDKRI